MTTLLRVKRYPPMPTMGAIGITVVFSAGLLLQPSRWAATPAYGNLLLILSPRVWGLLYASIAALLITGLLLPRLRSVVIGAHMFAVVLLLVWEAAFIIRWLTDPKTTIANVVAWAAYTVVVVLSARRIDNEIITERIVE